MAIKITKKQRIEDDVPGSVSYCIARTYMGAVLSLHDEFPLSEDEMLELKEAINNLDIK